MKISYLNRMEYISPSSNVLTLQTGCLCQTSNVDMSEVGFDPIIDDGQLQ